MSHLVEEIKFIDVSYKIKDKEILKNINGSFYEGKITTIVGPSGSGKTTLLKMCNGLISPTTGEIIVRQKNIQEYEPTHLRKAVGIALQSAPIIHGTVYDNLALPRILQKEELPKEEAISYLLDVGLDATHLYQTAADLSGGQRQKLSIARTLINQPKILLLDEITSALDPISAEDIEQLILSINKKYNVTIIWITHNIEQAKTMGDYSWFMKNGQLLESGISKQLFESSNKEIQQFIEGGKNL